MTPQFRRAVAKDLHAMQTIARRTIDSSYRSFIDDERVDWFLNSQSDDYLRKNLERAVVLTTDGAIGGFAVLKDGLIDLIMVDLELHGRGLGSALLAHCEEQLFRRHGTIRLESFEGNARANAFYRKHGWARAGVIPDSMSDGMKWIFEKKRGQ